MKRLFSPATVLHFSGLLSVKIHLSSHFSILITISNKDERISSVLVHHGVVFLSFHGSMSDFSSLIPASASVGLL